MKVNFKKLIPEAAMPQKAHPSDRGEGGFGSTGK